MGMRASILGLLSAATITTSASAAGPQYPVLPDMKPKAHFESKKEESIHTIIGTCQTDDVSQITQSIYMNLPGFYARLENRLGDELCSTQTFDIRVGRRWEKHLSGEVGKMQTPVGESLIIGKVPSVPFIYTSGRRACSKAKNGACLESRYFSKGEKILVSNTFTPEGKFVSIPMPYDWMRGFTLKSTPANGGRDVYQCVVHATSDQHTIGTPASHCCIGLTIDSMLEFYSLVAPQQWSGKPAKNVKIRLDYDLVEMEQTKDGAQQIVLHTDIYERGHDYSSLIKAELGGYTNIDEQRLEAVVADANAQFSKSYKNIRTKLAMGSFMTKDQIAQLHYRIPLKDVLTEELQCIDPNL